MNRALGVGGLSDSAKVRGLAERQGAGESVVSPAPVDHRTWVRTRLLDTRQCPDIVVSGSSTSGALSTGMFAPHTFQNAWIGGPSVEDFEALTSVLRRMSCHPKAIVLGVDPWWIGNPAYSEVRWMAWSDDYLDFHSSEGLSLALSVRARVYWTSLEDDLSYTTTRQSFALLTSHLRGTGDQLDIRRGTPEDVCAHVAPNHVYYARGFDGHFEKCPPLSDEQRHAVASNYLRTNMHLMGTWKELASTRIRQFGALLRDWTAMGSHVTLFAPPYNPITYDVLEQDAEKRALLARLDERLSAFGSESVDFINLRNPAIAGCAENEFIDSHHARRECAVKVADALRSRVQSLR